MGQKIIILGGGLWGSMLAFFFQSSNPNCDFELYEKNERLGGDHTWSFHSSDVSFHVLEMMKPLICFSWESQVVKFPLFTRTFPVGYHSILSSHFHESLIKFLPSQKVFLGTEKSPKDFSNDCVIFDCRNLTSGLKGGWQNFVGLDVTLKKPHGLEAPIIMDATVPQLDGYRFVYYLPWSSTRVLIEDTRYSDAKRINVEEWKKGLVELIEKQGWEIETVDRVEVGSLIIPFEEHTKNDNSPHVISLSGIAHEVTGYSLPDCVRLCHMLSTLPQKTLKGFTSAIANYKQERKRRSSFYRLLNRFLFLGSPAPLRYKMLQHFYKLPESLIQRFYAGQTSPLDMLKFFSGRPPLSLAGVYKVLSDQRSTSP